MSYSHLASNPFETIHGFSGSRLAPNNNGGLSFTIDRWTRLQRFLIMGSDQARFSPGKLELTVQNSKNLLECIVEDGPRVVREIVAISQAGRAIKNSPAIFALAVCASCGDSPRVRQDALNSLHQVCRTGTHLFEFVGYVNSMRGWGRGLKGAITAWYTDKVKHGLGEEEGLKQLAYQLVKYQQREGWSHRDVLRLAKPRVGHGLLSDLFGWVVKGPVEGKLYPDIVCAFEEAKTASKERVIELIQNDGLTREMIPTQFLNDREVADALFQGMPLTAMIRNLANLTEYGIFSADTERGQQNLVKACGKLIDSEYIHKSRVHPITILLAMKTYAAGRVQQGVGKTAKTKTWTPIPALVSALEKAFYLAFANVEPTGLNYVIGLDVSGSMSMPIPSVPQISSCEAAAAIGLTIAKTEKNYAFAGFASSIVKLNITAQDTLATAMRKAQMSNFGSTNPGALIESAIQERIPADVFIVITDNNINTGQQPAGILRRFRQVMNKPKAKLIVLSTYASKFSIADPNDGGMFDFAGFDADVPAMIAAAARE